MCSDHYTDHELKLISDRLNKGMEWKKVTQIIFDYLNNYNITLQEIYNWLILNYQESLNFMFLLGYFNYHGIETNINKEKAFELFLNASESNHMLA